MVVHPDGQERSGVPPADRGVTAPPQEEGGVFFATFIRAACLLYSRKKSINIDIYNQITLTETTG